MKASTQYVREVEEWTNSVAHFDDVGVHALQTHFPDGCEDM